jgi:methylphosphotriester-DNA--protein-cysteine methyltransferase
MTQFETNMISHINIDQSALKKLIRSKAILFAGNKKLKIYGRMDCSSGRRMKRENRVFFSSENEALENSFRPCKKCMKLISKNQVVKVN